MKDKHEQIIELLTRFEDKTATDHEIELLFQYLSDESNDETTRQYLEMKMHMYIPLQDDVAYWKNRFAQQRYPEKGTRNLFENANEPASGKWRLHLQKYFMRYAAAVLIIITPVTYLLVSHDAKRKTITSKNSGTPALKQNDKPPGANRAVLTLSDGSSIILDSSASGILANESGTVVQKTSDGMIVYNERKAPENATALYNTMTTPRGGQYQLMLADGTRVWLNAFSSITFPTTFAANNREVSITGEVYFEVAKNHQQPFTVKTGNDVEINVLGTHFNVNAYTDEASVNTTLIEGSLDVHDGNNSVRLVPGDQAQVVKSGINLLKDVNTEQVMAWKNGAFSFNKDNLDAVLRQISRWYDVQIVYEKDAPKRMFSGKMGRNLALSQIMKFFKEIDINVKLEGNNIVVMK